MLLGNHPSPSEVPPVRILLIEDDPGISLALREALVSEGYDVVLAAVGTQAAELSIV